MSLFNELVNKIIKNKRLTIYSLAIQTGIERSVLTKSFNGTRKLNIENFLKILPVLNLTPEEELKLRKEYINYSIGEENYNSYISLLSLLCNSSSKNSFASKGPRVNFSLDFPSSTITISNKRDVLNTLEFVINCEKNSENENRRIYTNITLPDFYDIMTNYPESEMGNLDFKRIILLNDSYKNESVDILYETIKYMKLGYFTDFILTNSSMCGYADIMFPFYLITSEYTVFMDYTFECGYVVKDKIQADIYADKFSDGIFPKATRYALRYSHILEEKEAIYSLFKNGVDHFYYIGRNVSPIFCDYNTWKTIAKAEIPDKDFLIKVVDDHYSFIADSIQKTTHIYFKSAIEEFVDDGIIHEIPCEYADPVPVAERLKMLTALRDRILNSDDEFYLIHNNVFGSEVTDCFCIYDNTKSGKQCCLSIGVNDDSEKTKYAGNFTCNISEESTVFNAVKFIRHMIISGLCYDQAESLYILDEQIERCKLKGTCQDFDDEKSVL